MEEIRHTEPPELLRMPAQPVGLSPWFAVPTIGDSTFFFSESTQSGHAERRISLRAAGEAASARSLKIFGRFSAPMPANAPRRKIRRLSCGCRKSMSPAYGGACSTRTSLMLVDARVESKSRQPCLRFDAVAGRHKVPGTVPELVRRTESRQAYAAISASPKWRSISVSIQATDWSPIGPLFSARSSIMTVE